MAQINMDLRETHSIGEATRERIVSSKLCPALAGHGISVCGVSDATAGFRFARLRPSMAQLLASIGGNGQVLMGEQFVSCPAGMAYLTPMHVPHAYHAARGGEVWKVAWIHYEEDLRGPALVRADGQALHSAIDGLYRESVGACERGIMHNWATLVALIARRLIGKLQIDGRLQALWEAVDGDLPHRWTNGELAQRAGISCEHLRRLCVAQLGASPMKHLTALRMRRADAMLRTGAYEVQAVAGLVGYFDAFAFSTAFRRHFGISPSMVVP